MARIKKAKSINELKSLSEKDVKVTNKGRVGIVNCDNLRLREEPNTESKIIRMLQQGDKVDILGNANDEFYEVQGGFVMKKFIDEK